MSVVITHLVKKYGEQHAVNDISFTIEEGEVLGFIGPNGSGKSTTMKCMCGIIPPTAGNITINGRTVTDDPLYVKKTIGYLPEHNPLYLDMFVREYLMHIDRYYHSGGGRNERIEETIRLTGLGREQHKKIGQLSKGYRQRVGLAQAIIHDPQVLILDEPTTGLDPNQIIEIRNLISGLSKNKTVILSTHILQEVEAICDRIIVINQGRIVANDATQHIRRKPDKKQTIFIEFNQPVSAEQLMKIPLVENVKTVNQQEFVLEGKGDSDLREEIFQFATDNGLKLLTMQQQQETLEEVFRKLTSN